MKAGKTYLVAVRYDFDAGPDRMYLWVNPALDREPPIEAADKRVDVVDTGVGSGFRIELSGWQFGEYDIDEIRFGPSWEFAVGKP